MASCADTYVIYLSVSHMYLLHMHYSCISPHEYMYYMCGTCIFQDVLYRAVCELDFYDTNTDTLIMIPILNDTDTDPLTTKC